MIVILDYECGNLASIQRMLQKIGVDSIITNDIETINKADKLIIAGVGQFDFGMSALDRLNLRSSICHLALDKKIPILGICLGMQLLCSDSEEGVLPGLGLIEANVLRFDQKMFNVKVPHMGWNYTQIHKINPLVTETERRFYFVHSYYVKCKNRENIVCTTKHGLDFDSVIVRENIFGVQFHPEKSHLFGQHLLTAFVNLQDVKA